MPKSRRCTVTFATNADVDRRRFRGNRERPPPTPRPSQGEVKKEQIKAFAGFLNLIGVGFVTVGVIAPVISILTSVTMGADFTRTADQVVNILCMLLASAGGGILFRWASNGAYRLLQENGMEADDDNDCPFRERASSAGWARRGRLRQMDAAKAAYPRARYAPRLPFTFSARRTWPGSIAEACSSVDATRSEIIASLLTSRRRTPTSPCGR